MRAYDAVADNPEGDQFSYLRRNFELVAMAKVATSAVEAKHMGILRSSGSHRDESRSSDRRGETDGLDACARRLPCRRSPARIFWCSAKRRLRSSSSGFI